VDRASGFVDAQAVMIVKEVALGTGKAFVRIVLQRFSLFTGCLGTGKVFLRIVPHGLQLL
jgi:hypothetical protein